MNASGMVGGMNSSLYLDSATSFSQSKQVGPGAVAKPKFIRFTNSTQSGKNVSKVRWLADENFFGVIDPFATEYFLSGSWSWVEEVRCRF